MQRPDAVGNASGKVRLTIPAQQHTEQDVAGVPIVGKAHGDGDHLLVVLLRRTPGRFLCLARLGFLGRLLGFPAAHFAFEDVVVDLPLLGIGQDRIGIANLLEGRMRLGFATGVAVRMPLHRRAAIGELDLVEGGIGLYAKRRVERIHGERGRAKNGGVHPSMPHCIKSRRRPPPVPCASAWQPRFA
ncbi:hypothetical protein D3C72_1561200 [compost metagenome]